MNSCTRHCWRGCVKLVSRTGRCSYRFHQDAPHRADGREVAVVCPEVCREAWSAISSSTPVGGSVASLDTPARLAHAIGRRTKALLFFAFAFAVMADPVSSVAYAIEAP